MKPDEARGLTGIYLIYDKQNKFGYVGQSVDIGRRWKFHLWELNANKHTNKALQKAWNEHKEEFYFSVLEQCARSELNEREVFWISKVDSYANGYNLTSGGMNAEKPKDFSAKVSYALKRRKSPLEGKKLTEEHRKKIAQKLKGNCNAGYGEANHASRPVVCLETGMMFACEADAGRFYGSRSVTPGTNIRKCCVKERRKAFGHTWAFEKAEEE